MFVMGHKMQLKVGAVDSQNYVGWCPAVISDDLDLIGVAAIDIQVGRFPLKESVSTILSTEKNTGPFHYSSGVNDPQVNSSCQASLKWLCFFNRAVARSFVAHLILELTDLLNLLHKQQTLSRFLAGLLLVVSQCACSLSPNTGNRKNNRAMNRELLKYLWPLRTVCIACTREHCAYIAGSGQFVLVLPCMPQVLMDDCLKRLQAKASPALSCSGSGLGAVCPRHISDDQITSHVCCDKCLDPGPAPEAMISPSNPTQPSQVQDPKKNKKVSNKLEWAMPAGVVFVLVAGVVLYMAWRQLRRPKSVIAPPPRSNRPLAGDDRDRSNTSDDTSRGL